MGAFVTMILAKFVGLAKWIGLLAVAWFLGFWDFLRDVAAWVFEQVLEVAISAVGALDLSGLQGVSPGWGSLPGDVVNILGLCGIGDALAIIAAAGLIRIGLQLIPFTRLGS